MSWVVVVDNAGVRELLHPGLDSLVSFLTRWYGPADVPDAPVCADPRLPGPLRDWFSTVARWSTAVTAQNTVLDSRHMRLDAGKVVFWLENQGVWLWGFDPDTEELDPAVYDRENGGRGWQPTGVDLSTFLLHVVVFEAVWMARYGAGTAYISPTRLAAVLAPMTPIPGACWRWPPPSTRFYAGPHLLAMAGSMDEPARPDEPAREVIVAGTCAAAVSYLEQIDGVRWDSHSWDEPNRSQDSK